jgi:O-antigen biosynthesis protein
MQRPSVLGSLRRAAEQAYRVGRAGGLPALGERLRLRLARERASRVYQAWVKRYDSLTDDDRRAISTRLERLPYQPLISVVMPVYNTPEPWLSRAIASVRSQLYPGWELCIADDHSSAPHVREVLEASAAQDSRIKVVFRARNGHISEASNSALELVAGEFVALVDHDDEIPDHALFMVAEELNAYPDAELIYTDEDKIDERGKRYFPFFKPDWDPDLLCSINSIAHLLVCRTSLIRRLGGFRVGSEGAQDYELALRAVEQIPETAIRHIPHILYHWRSIRGSMARTSGEKSYVSEAGRQALAAHLERRGVVAEVLPCAESSYRALYPLPKPAPTTSLVLAMPCEAGMLARVLRGLLEGTAYNPLEVLVVGPEAAPDDATVALSFPEDRRVRFVRSAGAEGQAAVLNHAVRQASGEVIALLVALEPQTRDWLRELVSQAMRPEVGAAGAMLYRDRGTLEDAGVILGGRNLVTHAYRGVPATIALSGRMLERTEMVQNRSAIAGTCLVLRRRVFDEVGGLDERNLPSAYYDVDLCLRIRQAGYRVLCTPHARLTCLALPVEHVLGPALEAQRRYFRTRWENALRRDPFHNPNLALDREDLSLAMPPRAVKPWRTGQ